jgi:hypothetical protein
MGGCWDAVDGAGELPGESQYDHSGMDRDHAGTAAVDGGAAQFDAGVVGENGASFVRSESSTTRIGCRLTPSRTMNHGVVSVLRIDRQHGYVLQGAPHAGADGIDGR